MAATVFRSADDIALTADTTVTAVCSAPERIRGAPVITMVNWGVWPSVSQSNMPAGRVTVPSVSWSSLPSPPWSCIATPSLPPAIHVKLARTPRLRRAELRGVGSRPLSVYVMLIRSQGGRVSHSHILTPSPRPTFSLLNDRMLRLAALQYSPMWVGANGAVDEVVLM